MMSDEPEGGDGDQENSETENENVSGEGGENPGTEQNAEVEAGAAPSDEGGDNVGLEEFPEDGEPSDDDDTLQKTAQDLEAVFDVPVSISAVLGRTHMEVSELLRLDAGDVIELDRKVGEAIDIYVNNRLIARGEVVLVDEKLGITMTEIIKTERH